VPTDALAIALEHHRAGRLRQAAAAYRALIDADPHHADALNWLGVLAFQAGRPDHAIPLLERAAKARPDDPAFAHNLGMAHLHSNHFTDAIEAFERAAKLAPDRPETLTAWGLAHLARRTEPDANAAVFAFRQAILAVDKHAENDPTRNSEPGTRNSPQSDLHRHLALALLATNRPDDAIAAFLNALEQNPHDPAAWHHLALAHRQKGDTKQVRKCLNKALEIDPENARAWYALATLDADENPDIAIPLFKKAIKYDPTYTPAHHALGRTLERAGRHQESMRAFAQAIRATRGTAKKSLAVSRSPRDPNAPYHDPDPLATLERRLTDPRTLDLHHALAANAEVFSPTKVPDYAIANLFDRYADTFDSHLRGKLLYAAPELIAQAVAELTAGDPEERRYDVLDLGCGTGLIGPLLRPLARTLDGVDLSPAILEKAREKNVYDALDVADMVALLNDRPQTYDLLTAADSIIYTGDLSPLFEAASKSLRPGGLFAFTVEAGSGDRYHLHKKTLRYTHSEPYLHHIARIHGYTTERFTPVIPRYEADHPVHGYLMVLRTPTPALGSSPNPSTS
jgi:predicted TPR repeat methyltransferase